MWELVIPLSAVALLAIIFATLAYITERKESRLDKAWADLNEIQREGMLRAGLDPDKTMEENLYLNPTIWLGDTEWNWPIKKT